MIIVLYLFLTWPPMDVPTDPQTYTPPKSATEGYNDHTCGEPWEPRYYDHSCKALERGQ